jgi:hypothetical protein
MAGDDRRGEMNPREHVLEAQHFYRADVDMESHGIGHIFLNFPDMYQAASWAFAMGIADQVRYVAPEDNLKKHISDPIRVIYEF